MQKIKFFLFCLLSISTNLNSKSNVMSECLSYVNPISYLNEYTDSVEKSKIKHGEAVTSLNVLLALYSTSLLSMVIHEFLGHFLFGRVFGLKPMEVSVGCGPELFKIKKYETKYILKLIPFGGLNICKADDLNKFSKTKKVGYFLAGPVSNLITAIVLKMIMKKDIKSPLVKLWLSAFAWTSIANGYCNLLPFPGYDGDQIINTIRGK